MGIYVQGYGVLSGPSQKDMAVRLIDAARQWSAERGLQDLFHASCMDNGAWISFYPPAEGIIFELQDSSIAFGAKTSVGGPGYHAALIELCSRFQSEFGVNWRWSGGGDETGYAVERDFQQLQAAFLGQLMAFCEFNVSNVQPGERHVLNLPEGWAMDGYEGVATPLGPIPAKLLHDTLDLPEDAEPLARRIFPWWTQSPDMEFWINTLLALLWTEAEWRAPRTPWEEHVHRVALGLGARFGSSLGDRLSQAVESLSELSRDIDHNIVPPSDGIGYLKRARGFFLPGYWRINLPGFYVEQLEDDGKAVCLWFGSEEIRASSFTIETTDHSDQIWSPELSREPDRQGNGCIFRVRSEAAPSAGVPGSFEGLAEIQARDQDGRVHLLLLRLFQTNEKLTSRLAEIAQSAWFDEAAARRAG